MIPSEAIAAAAEALRFRVPSLPPDNDQDAWWEDAKAALEAAAPHLRAQSLEDAADELARLPYVSPFGEGRAEYELLTRLEEDEAEALNAPKMSDVYDVNRLAFTEAMRQRALAECAAKRAIVQYVTGLRLDQHRDAETEAQYRAAWWIAVQLAKAYQDHPDYREDWDV